MGKEQTKVARTYFGTADDASAPRNYEDLHRQYYPFVVNLVRQHGVDENSKEDFASEALLRLWERGFLELFDPRREMEHEGRKYKAKFKSYLAKSVLSYMPGYRDKQSRVSSRELQILDLPVGDHGESWVELYGEIDEVSADIELLNALSEQELVERVRAYLVTVPRRSKYDICDLPKLWDALVEQVRDLDEVRWVVLAVRFGVKTNTMHNWKWLLLPHVATALGYACPVKRQRRDPH